MKEAYLQNYLVENYILIAMVVGIYFVISMKSAVDIFIKKRMAINMTLLLILSVATFHMNYLKENAILGLPIMITSLIYYGLKPLVMAIIINAVAPKNKFVYIPAIANFLFCFMGLFSHDGFYFGPDGALQMGMAGYASVITDWVYWGVFLLVLNMKFYRKTKINPLQAFFCIAFLMTANIMETIGVRPGILNQTYAVAFLFYYLIIHVHISQQVNEEKEIKLREQRVSLMLSQIQPHFLYNTLNTITALCRANPKLAEETTVKFSGYLRENMYNMRKNEMQPFSKELEHTNIYLDIEKLRFGDRVQVEYDIKSDDFDMPTLTLQPIVENAVKHGICNKLDGGTIKIATEKRGRDHIITISDNGIGFEIEKVLNDGKPHVGIHNVRERLKSTVRAEMEITSFIGIGTIVKITIPGERKNVRLERGERREILSIGR